MKITLKPMWKFLIKDRPLILSLELPFMVLEELNNSALGQTEMNKLWRINVEGYSLRGLRYREQFNSPSICNVLGQRMHRGWVKSNYWVDRKAD